MVQRRTIIKASGATVATAAVGGASLLFSTGRTVAATTDFTAANVNVGSDDGSLTYLEIAPDVTVTWDGFDTDVATVEMTWSVSAGGTTSQVGSTPFSEGVSTPTKDGEVSRTFNAISLLSSNGGALSASLFESSTDGGSSDTTVTLMLKVVLKDASSNTLATRNEIISTDFTVTVTNQAQTTGVTGSANTSVG